jgi:hypothetical protein
MPEPTSTTVAVATVAAVATSVPALSIAGIPLGLRPDILIAGFLGSLIAIILLNSVPGSTDTWRDLIRMTLKRMMVAGASSFTAGYLTPLVLILSPVQIADSLLLSVACVVGAGAQRFLANATARLSGSNPQPPAGGSN